MSKDTVESWVSYCYEVLVFKIWNPQLPSPQSLLQGLIWKRFLLFLFPCFLKHFFQNFLYEKRKQNIIRNYVGDFWFWLFLFFSKRKKKKKTFGTRANLNCATSDEYAPIMSLYCANLTKDHVLLLLRWLCCQWKSCLITISVDEWIQSNGCWQWKVCMAWGTKQNEPSGEVAPLPNPWGEVVPPVEPFGEGRTTPQTLSVPSGEVASPPELLGGGRTTWWLGGGQLFSPYVPFVSI